MATGGLPTGEWIVESGATGSGGLPSGAWYVETATASEGTSYVSKQKVASSIVFAGSLSQDACVFIDTDVTTLQSLRTTLATEIQTGVDLLLTVSERIGQVVIQDVHLSVAATQFARVGLKISIVTLDELRQEIQLGCATRLIMFHDISLQIAELVGNVVRQNLSVSISTDLALLQDLLAQVSTELARGQDLLASASTGISIRHDLYAVISVGLSTMQDLLADILSTLAVLVRQDLSLSLSISTDLGLLHDLLAQVGELGAITQAILALFAASDNQRFAAISDHLDFGTTQAAKEFFDAPN